MITRALLYQLCNHCNLFDHMSTEYYN